MLRSGHYGAALVLYAPVGLALSSIDPTLAVGCGAAAVALSTLPDWDRRLSLLDHRGPTHSLTFLLVAAGIVGWLGTVVGDAIGYRTPVSALLGVLVVTVSVGSHLLADAVTPAGVPLLGPLRKRRYALPLTTAAHPVANDGLFALGVAATVTVGVVAAGP